MPGMSAKEIDLVVYKYLGVDAGYLCGGNGWSYSSHASFYSKYCDLEIDVARKREELRAKEEKSTTAATYRAILAEAAPRDQAKILRGTLEYAPIDSWSPDVRTTKEKLAEQMLSVATRLESEVVPGIAPAETSETVHQALKDAEQLLKTEGPTSAVDRVHTALHGHLRYLCKQAGITVEAEDPTASQYLKALLNEHPRFQVAHPNRDAVKTIVRTSAAIVDSLGTLRNNASVAHPNDDLLEDDEARLLINVTRSLMHYIDKKLTA